MAEAMDETWLSLKTNNLKLLTTHCVSWKWLLAASPRFSLQKSVVNVDGGNALCCPRRTFCAYLISRAQGPHFLEAQLFTNHSAEIYCLVGQVAVNPAAVITRRHKPPPRKTGGQKKNKKTHEKEVLSHAKGTAPEATLGTTAARSQHAPVGAT